MPPDQCQAISFGHQAHATCVYLYDAAASAALLECQKVIRQTNGLAQPIEHYGLQFGAGGTGRPREANAADAVAQHIAQYRGKRIARRKVRMESRMLPVRYAWHYFILHIVHNLIPILWLMRCFSCLTNVEFVTIRNLRQK